MALQSSPIDMIIFCPRCATQHIDLPAPHMEGCKSIRSIDPNECSCKRWSNPPHRSHECQACRHIWRHCDVPTNGVLVITSRGKSDSPPRFPVTRKLMNKIEKSLLPFARVYRKQKTGDRELLLSSIDTPEFKAACEACELVEEHLI